MPNKQAKIEVEQTTPLNDKVKFFNKTFTYKQLFKTLFIIVLIIAAFMGGWFTKCYSDTQWNSTVMTEAQHIVKSLK